MLTLLRRRTGNLVVREDLSIEELKEQGLWNGRYISAIGLIPHIRRLGSNVRGLEIGTCRGENCYKFLEECKNISKMDTVDPFVEFNDSSGGIGRERIQRFRRLAYRNLGVFVERVQIHELTSEQFASSVAPDMYHFIFVDGNHYPGRSMERITTCGYGIRNKWFDD